MWIFIVVSFLHIAWHPGRGHTGYPRRDLHGDLSGRSGRGGGGSNVGSSASLRWFAASISRSNWARHLSRTSRYPDAHCFSDAIFSKGKPRARCSSIYFLPARCAAFRLGKPRARCSSTSLLRPATVFGCMATGQPRALGFLVSSNRVWMKSRRIPRRGGVVVLVLREARFPLGRFGVKGFLLRFQFSLVDCRRFIVLAFDCCCV
jgi:hypothetical protein